MLYVLRLRPSHQASYHRNYFETMSELFDLGISADTLSSPSEVYDFEPNLARTFNTLLNQRGFDHQFVECHSTRPANFELDADYYKLTVGRDENERSIIPYIKVVRSCFGYSLAHSKNLVCDARTQPVLMTDLQVQILNHFLHTENLSGRFEPLQHVVDVLDYTRFTSPTTRS